MAEHRPQTSDPGRVIAHRGASQVAPENTLAAIRTAAEQGARWIEFDVSLLGDGTPVVSHDATLDRCTDATGPLAGIGLADLARIHAGRLHGAQFAGEPLPTLEAVLGLIEELGLFANLEMKTHRGEGGPATGATSKAVSQTLSDRTWAAGRIVVSSFDLDELGELRERRPDMPLAALWEEPPGDWRARLAALGAEAMHVHFAEVNQTLLAEAQRSGVRVRVYTINRPELMVPLRELGLTGVITDHPPLFLQDEHWAAWARTGD